MCGLPLAGTDFGCASTIGLPSRVADLGEEAERGKVLLEPRGGAATLGVEGRVGGDRGDAKQCEQPLEAFVEIVVDALQDGVDVHEMSLLLPSGPVRP